MNFNSHPREGGDAIIFGLSLSCFSISIPTPARGVTYWSCLAEEPEPYFNSHPREGGDLNGVFILGRFFLFQFPPPRGG